MSRLDLAARQFLGVPFHHQGRDPTLAVDCIGLLSASCEALGWLHYLTHDRTDYSPAPHDGVLEAQLQDAFGAPVPKSDMQAGDVVAMRSGLGGPIRHVGILGDHPSGELSLIHTSATTHCVTEHILNPAARRLIALVFRPAGEP